MMVPIWYLPVAAMLGMLIGFCLPLPRGMYEGRWAPPGPPRPAVPDNPNPSPMPAESFHVKPPRPWPRGSNPSPTNKRKPAPPKSPPRAKGKGGKRG